MLRTKYLLDDFDDFDEECEDESLSEVNVFRPRFKYVFEGGDNPHMYKKVRVENPDGTYRIRTFDIGMGEFID